MLKPALLRCLMATAARALVLTAALALSLAGCTGPARHPGGGPASPGASPPRATGTVLGTALTYHDVDSSGASGTISATATVQVYRDEVLEEVDNVPVFLISQQAIFLCAPRFSGGRVAGPATCSRLPRSAIVRSGGQAIINQYLHPLAPTSLAAKLFAHTAHYDRSVAGVRSRCISGKSIINPDLTDYICVSVADGFLTALHTDSQQLTLLTARLSVPVGPFALPARTHVR